MQLDPQRTDDLDALFESAASAPSVPVQPSTATVVPIKPAAVPEQEASDVFHRIGSITRKLHDALQELGYDKQIEDAVSLLPDARTRLDYIARLTGNAADTVLNKVDAIQSEQDQVEKLVGKLRLLLSQEAATESPLVTRVNTFLEDYTASRERQRAYLTEIMLAQDFHDLTGQVIRKIVSVAANLEEQLVILLLEATPPEKRSVVESAGLSGPVVDAKGRNDVVTNQAQVDDLLESLGF
jgi:chemotaxis protein CheZ